STFLATTLLRLTSTDRSWLFAAFIGTPADDSSPNEYPLAALSCNESGSTCLVATTAIGGGPSLRGSRLGTVFAGASGLATVFTGASFFSAIFIGASFFCSTFFAFGAAFLAFSSLARVTFWTFFCLVTFAFVFFGAVALWGFAFFLAGGLIAFASSTWPLGTREAHRARRA